MNRPVLLWHPQVHRYYNEELYYVALRFAPYRRDVKEKLRTALDDQGISGCCLYEIFGTYDILLRVWLTSSLLPRLLKVFEDFPSLTSQPVFRAEDIRHWAFGAEIDESVVRARRRCERAQLG